MSSVYFWVIVPPTAYIYYVINRCWSHLCIQMVSTRPLELMLYCHVMDLGVIVISLILGCAIMLSNLFVQLTHFDIWAMDSSCYIYLDWCGWVMVKKC